MNKIRIILPSLEPLLLAHLKTSESQTSNETTNFNDKFSHLRQSCKNLNNQLPQAYLKRRKML